MPEATSFSRPHRREHAEAILRAAVAAADPAPLVQRALHGAVELGDDGPIHLVAIGKAAPAMAAAAADALGDRVTRRLIVAPHGTPAPDGALFGAHPAPDEGSRNAGQAVLEMLESTPPDERILVLLSGGASSCIALPLGDITVEDYAECVTRLMHAGADIGELNLVRKQIDALKGGRMALHAAPSPVLALVLSDVVGDPLDVIASGPLTPDVTTCDDALLVLRRHGLIPGCPPSVLALLERCVERGEGESPAAEHPAFEQVRVRVVGGNDVAVEGAAEAAARLGYRVLRAPEPVTGRAREAGATMAREARRLLETEPVPACIVAGGETTVAVGGDGRGGRNQELVLSACLALDGLAGITVGSVGTDGVDGNSPAAGAIADESTLPAAGEKGLDVRSVLERNDSYAWFDATDGLLVTGATGTNVNDVHIALIESHGPAAPRA